MKEEQKLQERHSKPMEPEVQRAICKDAQLTRIWLQQHKEIQWWIGPIFHLWMKIIHYERQWPGITAAAGPGSPSVVTRL